MNLTAFTLTKKKHRLLLTTDVFYPVFSLNWLEEHIQRCAIP